MQLKGKKILIFVENEYEDLELQYPKLRLIEAGADVTIVGVQTKEPYKGKKGYPCQADTTFDKVDVKKFDALIIPGGHAPDKLRMIPKAIEIVQKFAKEKKLIAFICHAGSVLISAKLLKGVKSTSWISIKEDMVNAGAKWVDEAVVNDKNFISSRYPEDLPKFCAAIIQHLQ